MKTLRYSIIYNREKNCFCRYSQANPKQQEEITDLQAKEHWDAADCDWQVAAYDKMIEKLYAH